jgi:hypothetical protein
MYSVNQYLLKLAEAREHFSVRRLNEPLLEESHFVAAAREAIPAVRVTTSQFSGGLSARDRGRVTSARAGRGIGR